MKTEAIQKFLREQYSDENLAAILAHAEDGKLSYNSCCCLIGIPSATHRLQGNLLELEMPRSPDIWEYAHAIHARGAVDGAIEAEKEFKQLGEDDKQRRAFLIPLIQAEMERREKLRTSQNDEPARVLEEAAKTVAG